jgi:CheY-like chemotaxis protein
MDVEMMPILEKAWHRRPSRDAGTLHASSGRGLVLVADDDVTSRRILIEQLKRLGVGAMPASDGREAVEAVARLEYGLVLMDLDMPDMDGYEATRRIRAAELGTGRRLPIVASTASLTDGTRERCIACGMDGLLNKPLTRPVLLELLARWLPHRVASCSGAARAAAAPGVADASLLRDAPIDLARLFETFGDDERRISAFLHGESIPSIGAALDRLAAAIAERDADASAVTARTVRGAASTLGADMIAVAMMTVEVAVRSANWESAQTSLRLAAGSAGRIQSWLDAQAMAVS